MNRKSFLATLLIAIAAPFIPIQTPQKKSALCFGPQLIGEGVGAARSNPEVIAPLDLLKKRLGDIKVTGNLRGRDMDIKKTEIKGSMPLEYFKANKDQANKLRHSEYFIKRDRLN